MKKLSTLFVFFFVYISYSQSLSVFDVDASNFPIIKAKFFAFDKDGNRIHNINQNDISIYQNGKSCMVKSISCPQNVKIANISSILIFDISGSMGTEIGNGIRLDLAKTAGINWIMGLPNDSTECAIGVFDDMNNLYSDFTKDKSSLLSIVNNLTPRGGTDYDFGLLHAVGGGLHISKRAKFKKVIIFLTDGFPYKEPLTKVIIDEAKNQDCQIYSITLGFESPTSLKQISESTKGKWFENITTKEQARDVYLRILNESLEIEPCEIVWEANYECDISEINAIINFQNIQNNLSFTLPTNTIPKIQVYPSFINFGKVKPGEFKDTIITITAKNIGLQLSEIEPEYGGGDFEIIEKTLPIDLQPNQSTQIKVRFMPTDSSINYLSFKVLTNLCSTDFSLYGGFPGKQMKNKTLVLTHPNGGEEFIIGTDTTITWSGISKNDYCKLEYTFDNGNNWIPIAKNVQNLEYNWKKIPKPASDSCLVRVKQIGEASLDENFFKIEWKKNFGGSRDDVCYDIITSHLGDYILIGSTNSDNFDVKERKGGYYDTDGFLLRITPTGDFIESMVFGGVSNESLNSIVKTSDKGYIIVGSTQSKTGDVKQNKGEYDIWVIKLDSTLKMTWNKTYGGAANDLGYKILELPNKEYLLMGNTMSKDGDLADSLQIGKEDVLVLKIDSVGGLKWIKTYGSPNSDLAYSLYQTKNGYFAIGGRTFVKLPIPTSVEYEWDAWIFEINNNGDLLWQKKFGGNEFDTVDEILENNNGQLIAYGTSKSKDRDFSINYGLEDLFIAKFDNYGNLRQINTYGTAKQDFAQSIVDLEEGGYLISAFVSSDSEILKISEDGTEEWNYLFGGNYYDYPTGIIKTYDDGYLLAGYSNSVTGQIDKNKGSYDFWILKFFSSNFSLQSDVSDNVFRIVQPKAVANDIDIGKVYIGRTKDSVFKAFIKNNGKYHFKVDSIFFEGPMSDAFKVVSYNKYQKIDINNPLSVEFNFSPKIAGVHNVVVVIVTTVDTLRVRIRGIGIETNLNFLANSVDFGKVLVGKYKDSIKVGILKNIGNTDVSLNKIKFAKPNDSDFVSLDINDSITLKPQEVYNLSLRFSARSLGLTNGTVEFYFEGIDSPLIANLYGEGIYQPLPIIQVIMDSIPTLICEDNIKSSIHFKNIGEEILTINDIQISGENSTDFIINHSFPILIEPGQTKIIELTFNPSAPGYKKCEIKIESNSDVNPIYVIEVSGRKELIDFTLEDILDIGSHLIYSPIKKTFKITNLSSIPNTLNIRVNNPSILITPSELQLQPNQTTDFTIEYPPFSQEIMIRDTLIINESNCNVTKIAHILGEVVSTFAEIRVDSISGFPGDKIKVPIILNNSVNLDKTTISGFHGKLYFNPTLLFPTQYKSTTEEQNLAYINLENLPIIQYNNSVMLLIEFIVGLGNNESCELVLKDFNPINGKTSLNLINGKFTLLGICEEGGKRLINPSRVTKLLQISPNPSDGNVNIELNLVEKGTTSLKIYNLQGMLVEHRTYNKVGKISFTLETQNYTNGLYFVELQTPTVVKREKLLISK